MPRPITPFGLLMVLALTLACGDDNEGDPNAPDGGTNRVLTATVNGAPFTATLVSGALLGANLTITANDGSKSISIVSNNITGAGTYPLNMGNPNSALAQIIDSSVGTYSTGYLGGAGTITLTTATLGRITGTFAFTAYTVAGTGAGQPVVTVQNGSFDIRNIP